MLLNVAALATSCSAALLPQSAKLDPKACMGTWYVQHQKPALKFLESGARNGKEVYTWNDDTDGFSVEYTLNRKDAPDDKITTVRQRGWVKSNAEWQVAPVIGGFRPPLVRLPFIILDCEPDSHMVCSGGLESWMYLMTREQQPDAALVDSLLSKVRAAGFDMAAVEPMAQG